MIYQDSPHQLRRYREEMASVLPVDIVASRKAEIGLVHNRRALQRVIGTLTSQVVPRQAAQFVIDQRDKRLSGGNVAATPASQ
jgi:hypothetical protein